MHERRPDHDVVTTQTEYPDILPEDPDVDVAPTRPRDTGSEDPIAGILGLGLGEDESRTD